jgi:hypothetical protein
MKKTLILFIVIIICISCKKEDEINDGILASFTTPIPFAYLDLERFVVNKVVNCNIEYVDENISYNVNNHQIKNSTIIYTRFEEINLSQVIINGKESKLEEFSTSKFFLNGSDNEDSVLKFNNYENIIELDIDGERTSLKFTLDQPVKFKNIKRDDIIKKNSDFTIYWNSNTSRYAKLSYVNDDVTDSGSWLISNTGSIILSKKLLKELKSGTYNFTIERFDFIRQEIEEGKNCLIEFESSHSVAVKIE